MNEKLDKIQKILETFKEMHLRNSDEYKKGTQEYRKLTPTGEWNGEHNLSFAETQKVLHEIKKSDNEKSFITYLSDSLIFGLDNIGQEDLNWKKYTNIVKKSPNYLKYFENLKKGDTKIKGSYQVVFKQDRLNDFCSSIVSWYKSNSPTNKEVSEEEFIVKIKEYNNIKDREFKFVRNGITVIVGENDVGKTNLLDFIYYRNHEWDGIDNEKHVKIGGNCQIYSPLFFGKKNIRCELHSNFKFLVPRTKEVRYTYRFYYFDLKTVTEFLGKRAEETKIWKLKRHSFYMCSNEIAKVEKTIDDHWLLDYGSNEKFRITLIQKEEDGRLINLRNEYIGLNKHAKKSDHSIENIGSGYQKLKKLESLIDDIKKQNASSEEEIFSPLLIIDEPEVFLHPSSVSNAANLIKNLRETTTILTTHSPSFLYHFDLTNYEKTSLVILKKDEKENLKDPWYLEDFLKDQDIETAIKKEYKDFAEKKNENINCQKFYRSKWKRLLKNHEILRVFFAKKVLFVEGMVDYILFNNILKEELYEKLKNVEIIPMFGKFHYIFFYKLAEWLKIDYWFLLETDKCKDEKDGKEWKDPIHENFWNKYGKDNVEEVENEIMHGKENKETKISWIHYNLEEFLGIKENPTVRDGEYNLICKADKVLDNLRDSAKLNELKKIFTNFLKVKEE